MDLRSLYSKLSPLLRPFGYPYASVMRCRRQAYVKHRLAQYQSRIPCVSIGNIAWGGSGKTPLTTWVLQWAKDHDLRAVVLSRGYGGQPGSSPLLVKDHTSPSASGDEALMLARFFPEMPVLVFPRRSESARYAEESLEPDLFVLEDGMQHLAMAREVDIVLLRPEDVTNDWNRVIPSGSWREGASALHSATCFAMKINSEYFSELKPEIQRRLKKYKKPLFTFCLEPAGLRPLFPNNNGKAGVSGSILRAASAIPRLDGPYILASGVGNPQSVEESATRLMGRPPLQHFAFDDHHAYTRVDVQAMVKLSAVPLPVVCTAKDAVKLEAFKGDFAGTPVWVLETRIGFGPALFTNDSFVKWWDAWWNTRLSSGHKP